VAALHQAAAAEIIEILTAGGFGICSGCMDQACASKISTDDSIIRAKALKVNAHLGVYSFTGPNGPICD